jgi:hypothetical protein
MMQPASITPPVQIQSWPVERLIFYARNPRKNDAAVDRMCGSIREFGFKVRYSLAATEKLWTATSGLRLPVN